MDAHTYLVKGGPLVAGLVVIAETETLDGRWICVHVLNMQCDDNRAYKDYFELWKMQGKAKMQRHNLLDTKTNGTAENDSTMLKRKLKLILFLPRRTIARPFRMGTNTYTI